MPNHIHGIIILTDHSHTLSKVVQGFKTFSSRRINQLRSLSKVPVWQRGYYEHIIRDEKTLQKIREYIVNNPYNWKTDEMHPSQKFPISKNITSP
ncbi:MULTISPECIES: transposase [Oscillatoriales]